MNDGTGQPAPKRTEGGRQAGAPSRLVAVVGATGTGKSDLAIRLAEWITARGGAAEIVNADAMQLYRGMDIGTAKVPPAARRGIPHHLLDVLDVTEDASVAWYQGKARAAVAAIGARGAVPILVGGSGLYVCAVLYGFTFPPHDPRLRRRLEEQAAQQGVTALAERLRDHAPALAARVDLANPRRVIRALEAVELGGAEYAGRLPEHPASRYDATVLGLQCDREALVRALDERVERMWRAGLADEVRSLLPVGLAQAGTAARAIGYAQALAHLQGRTSRADAIAETQRLTRRYARRQVSWFRRYPEIRWIPVRPGDPPPVAEAARLAGWGPGGRAG